MRGAGLSNRYPFAVRTGNDVPGQAGCDDSENNPRIAVDHSYSPLFVIGHSGHSGDTCFRPHPRARHERPRRGPLRNRARRQRLHNPDPPLQRLIKRGFFASKACSSATTLTRLAPRSRSQLARSAVVALAQWSARKPSGSASSPKAGTAPKRFAASSTTGRVGTGNGEIGDTCNIQSQFQRQTPFALGSLPPRITSRRECGDQDGDIPFGRSHPPPRRVRSWLNSR